MSMIMKTSVALLGGLHAGGPLGDDQLVLGGACDPNALMFYSTV